MLLVKVGGGNANKLAIARDLKNLGEQFIFVHGGRAQADSVAEKFGQPTKRIVSPSGMTSVLTDQTALDLLTMVYAGLLNTQWVAAFQAAGLNAVGLSGVDGRLWRAERKRQIISVENGRQKLITDTFTGKLSGINSDFLELLLERSYVPVLTQPALGSEGELLNTDNDRNLAFMAGALGVKKLVILFEAPGLLRDVTNPQSIMTEIAHQDLESTLPYASGGMKKKILGAIEAFKNGVEEIYWGDSRIEQAVSAALQGRGTKIT